MGDLRTSDAVMADDDVWAEQCAPESGRDMSESETMIERVARAMWQAAVPDNPWDGASEEDYYDGPGRNTVREMARAAIEAMREPTKAMLDASWKTCVGRPADDYMAVALAAPGDAHRHKTKIRHRAMIDAALSEGEG